MGDLVVSPTSELRSKAEEEARKSYLENYRVKKLSLPSEDTPKVCQNISEDMMERKKKLMPLGKLANSQLSKIKECKKGTRTTRSDTKKQIELPNIYDLKHILAYNQLSEDKRLKDLAMQTKNHLKRKLNFMRQIMSPKKTKHDTKDLKLQGEFFVIYTISEAVEDTEKSKIYKFERRYH
jgi:hypothetical protein